ncbi:hypothetical protein HC864_05870 [Candidatus Gracilibacteria bacterium]|nr:hypothetical protein [Candidatus Gracilibacteria bacterium]
MNLSKGQFISFASLGISLSVFLYGLSNGSWDTVKKTFSDNASTIGLVGIIGSLSAITLTTARDGIIKRGEDQNKHMNEMNTKILETISGQLADIQSQLDLSNPNGSLFQMNKKIDGVEASLNKKIDGVETRLTQKIDGVEASLNKRIDGVETRLINAIQINTKKIEQNSDDIKKVQIQQGELRGIVLGATGQFDKMTTGSSTKLTY